jgi:hypothetical protein
MILDIDGVGRDAMDNDSVCWNDELSLLSKAPNPPFVLLELYSLCCSACEYLYITAFELVYGDYLDRFSGCVVAD